MIAVTPHMRILLATQPADFRKGIDGLAGVCKNILDKDPFSGYVFVFVNKKRSSIKILFYDGQGFWLCQKRLSKGRFKRWPEGNGQPADILDPYQLTALVWNGNPAPASRMWKKLSN